MAQVFSEIVKPDFFPTQEHQSARSAVQTISIPVRVRQVAQHALPEVTHQVGKNLHAQIALFAPAVAHATAQACRLFAMPAHLLLLGAQAVQTATTIQSILAARQPLAQRAQTEATHQETQQLTAQVALPVQLDTLVMAQVWRNHAYLVTLLWEEIRPATTAPLVSIKRKGLRQIVTLVPQVHLLPATQQLLTALYAPTGSTRTLRPRVHVSIAQWADF